MGMTPLVCPNGCGVPIVDGPEVSADNPWAAQLIADHLHMECPETAPAVPEFPAGNGAPRLGEGPADEDAPASAPVPVVTGDRADVAHDVTDVGLALRCSCGQWSMLHRNSFGLDAYDEHARHVVRRRAVARTLDVAEATADKARAVGLARETAS